MPFSQYGNGDNIAGAGAGGAEKSQYYGHNSAVSVGQGTYPVHFILLR